MIDFRYHLVSIISIFLALAVGIVLGAGPLQSNLGSTLGDQVVALRTEKQTLNQKLAASEKLLAAGEEYAAAVTPRLVTGRLTGHGVVVIALPSAESNLVESTTDVLVQAGATPRGTVTLTADWFDPGKSASREAAAEQAASNLGLTPSTSGEDLLREVLAKLTVSQVPIEASQERIAALAALTDAGLVKSSVPDLVTADLAVVISGDYAGTAQLVEARSTAVRDLSRRLEILSKATVVAGGAPVQVVGQPETSDAVSAIRGARETASLISTVDHARDGMGPSIVVLAIEAQLANQVGHYGIAADATSVVPKVSVP